MPAGLIGALIGEGMGLINNAIGNKMQLKQQEALNEQTAQQNKDLAVFNNKLAMDMWENTNYSAQVEQLNKAGLSTALLYKGAGAGGTTAAPEAAGIGGGKAEKPDIGMGIAQMAQIELLKAQKENIQADTANKTAQASKISGVDTENVKANTGLTQVQTQIATFEKDIKGDTLENTIARINTEAAIVQKNLRIAGQTADIQGASMEDQIKTFKATALGAIIENALKEANIANVKRDTKAIGEKIAQEWEKIAQGDTKLAQEAFMMEIKANYPGLTQVLGKISNSGLEALFNMTVGENSWKPEKIHK